MNMANLDLIENGELRMENNSTNSGFLAKSNFFCENNSQLSILNSQLNNEVSNVQSNSQLSKTLCMLMLAMLSCSNEGFESKVVADSQGKALCFNAEGVPVEISENLCNEMGWQIVVPQSSSSAGSESSSSGGESSSSGEAGSSSSGTDGSSSSDGESSSSLSSSSGIPGPIIEGSLVFRNFDYSGGDNKVYFLNTDIDISTDAAGNSKILNSLSISNAVAAECGEITVKVTGGGLDGTPGAVTAAGMIFTMAVATCNGKEVQLEMTDVATVVPDPEPSLIGCSFGEGSQYLMHRKETLKVVASAEAGNNYGRCTVEEYEFGDIRNTTGSFDLSEVALGESKAKAAIKCGNSASVPSDCPAVFVAEGYVEAGCNHADGPFREWKVPAATTIIKHKCCQPKLKFRFDNCGGNNHYTLLIEGFAKLTSNNGAIPELPTPSKSAIPEAPYPECKPYSGSNPSPGDTLFYYPQRILMEVTSELPTGGFTCESW
ncbi:MAG: hypothetical protein LBU89_08775 [Fibromonadaceae bacterium]|jgi:hypothetical protein|nr:hypothetical protein [Fibromonadaceae bacterium]